MFIIVTSNNYHKCKHNILLIICKQYFFHAFYFCINYFVYLCKIIFNSLIMVSRIEAILTAKDLTQTQFAASINIQRSTLSHILSGRNKPSLDFVLKVVEAFPEINIEWLTLGIGEMYKAGYEVENDGRNSTKKQQGTTYSLFDDLEDEQINEVYVSDNASSKNKSNSSASNTTNSSKQVNNNTQSVVNLKSPVGVNGNNSSATAADMETPSVRYSADEVNHDSQMKNRNSESVSNVEIPIVENVNKKLRAESVVILYNDGTYQVLK